MKIPATSYRCAFLILLSFLCLNVNKAQVSYFPPLTGNWETTSPSSLGWCNENIDSLYNYLDRKNTKAFLIIKDGRIVLEKYFGNFTQDSIWYWASAGKTLTGFSVGLAQQEGLLKISESSNKYLGKGWSSLSAAQEDSIKIWHHLTMTTGLDDGVADADCTDPACLKYKSPAGSRWAYHNAPYTLLDKVIEGATGGNLNSYITKKFTTKIGIKGLFVKSGYLNVFYSNARSMARFGILLLNKGIWDGTIIMSDTQYFYQQTHSSQSINPSYGLLTWLNGQSSFMAPGSQLKFNGSLNPDAPKDMFAAWGKNGQYINVVPSQKLVLIRMGNAPGGTGAASMAVGFNNEIWQYVNRLSCTGSAEIKEMAGFTLGPNPVKTGSSIKISAQISKGESISTYNVAQIIDLFGRIVQEIPFTPSASFELPINLTPGVYHLRLCGPTMWSPLQRIMVVE